VSFRAYALGERRPDVVKARAQQARLYTGRMGRRKTPPKPLSGFEQVLGVKRGAKSLREQEEGEQRQRLAQLEAANRQREEVFYGSAYQGLCLRLRQASQITQELARQIATYPDKTIARKHLSPYEGCFPTRDQPYNNGWHNSFLSYKVDTTIKLEAVVEGSSREDQQRIIMGMTAIIHLLADKLAFTGRDLALVLESGAENITHPTNLFGWCDDQDDYTPIDPFWYLVDAVGSVWITDVFDTRYLLAHRVKRKQIALVLDGPWNRVLSSLSGSRPY
jgi:hypothetical protein